MSPLPCLKQQSPIDIDAANPIPVAFPAGYLVRHWPADLCGIPTYEGHGWEFKITAGNDVGLTLEGNFYKLLRFHFHGPSEHKLNGRHYPLEVHFVHQLPSAVDTTTGFAVIGILLDAGAGSPEANQFFKELGRRFSEANKHGESAQPDAAPMSVNPESLLPADKHDFYRYEGALTTDPCHDNPETVRWIVMRDIHTLSQDAYDDFTQVKHEQKPLVDLNRRYVLCNFS